MGWGSLVFWFRLVGFLGPVGFGFAPQGHGVEGRFWAIPTLKLRKTKTHRTEKCY